VRSPSFLLLFALLGPRLLLAQNGSPLARAWGTQAQPIARVMSPVHLAVALTESLPPLPLPAAAVPELRTIYPTVGLEDSLRALYRVRLSPTLIGYVVQVSTTEGPSIQLVVHNTLRQQWTGPITLAVEFGDAGFTLRSEAWIGGLFGDGRVGVARRWATTDWDLENDSLPPTRTDSLAIALPCSDSLRFQAAAPGDSLWQRFLLTQRR
jgi:hypothetical protein